MPRASRQSAAKRELEASAPRVVPGPNSLPDLALQFVPCLEDLAATLGPNIIEDVKSGIKSRLGEETDVRYACINLAGTRTGTIGIWTTKPADFVADLVRSDSLKSVKPLSRGGNCWMYVNANFMKRELKKDFDARPHRLSADGKPDEKGPTHIFEPSLSFELPRTVITSVPGLDERPRPDVKFTLELTDTLKVSNLQIKSDFKSSLDTHTGLLNFLTGAGLILFFPAGIALLVQRIKVGQADPPALKAGIGAAAAQFFVPQILVPGRKKVSLIYDDIQVDKTGLKTAGAQQIDDRSPAVRITGPTNLKIRGQKLVSGKFDAVTTDLRPDLQFRWRVSTGFTSTARRAVIPFLRGSTQPGGSFTRTVRVTVTDADGLTASASQSVRIQVVDAEDEPPKGKSPKPVLL